MTKRHEKIARDCINAAIARIAQEHGAQIDARADYAAQGKAYVRAQGIKTLLTLSNPKLAKSLKKINAISIGLSLMPHYRGTCPYSTGECRKLCLHTSGMPFAQSAKNRARITRTNALLRNPILFYGGLLADITRVLANAARKGINEAFIRLNVVSDWDYPCELYRAIHEIGAMHDLTVYAYEYTKDWHDNKHEAVRAMQAGYLYRVYSVHEHTSLRAIKDKVSQGKPVAVVFRDYTGKPDTLPATWHGMPVIDGVEHDMRPLDCALTGAPKGHVVALAPIGLAKRHIESPFMWDLQDGARC